MLKSLLYHIDLFGVPIGMNFSGRDKAKSKLGGFCTFLYFGFAIWAFYTASKDMFSLSNPKSISSQSHNDDPEEMIISPESFPLAFQIQNQFQDHFFNESIYSLKIYQINQERITHGNGTKQTNLSSIEILTEKCSSAHFGEKASLFSDIIDQGAICISRNQSGIRNITLQGVYESQIYKYLTFEISKCDQSNSLIVCAPETTIDNLLSLSWINVFYANLVMTPQNYSYPDSRFLDSYYKLISPNEYHEIYGELEKIEVKNDIGWFSESIETQEYLKINRIIETSQSLSNSSDLTFLSISFGASKLQSNYSRTDKKIQEVLAEAGGITSYVILIIGIITSPYANLKYQETLMNELFDVIESDKKDNKKFVLKKNKKVRSKVIDMDQESKRRISKHQEFAEECRINPTISKESSINEKNLFHEKLVNNHKTSREKLIQEFKISPPATTPALKISNLSESPRDNIQKSYLNPEIKEACLLNLDKNFIQKKRSIRPIKVSKDGISDAKSISPEYSNSFTIQKNKQEPSISKDQSEIDAVNSPFEKIGENFLVVNEMNEKYSEFPESKREDKIFSGDEEENNITKKHSNHEKPNIDESLIDSKFKKIDIGFWEYMCSFIYKSRALKEKFKVLEEGIKNLEMRLDIVNVLRRLREVEKLETLLFDFDQLILFKYLPKPRITNQEYNYLTEEHSTNKLIRKPTFVEDIASKDRFLKAYEKVLQKKLKTDIDQKLLTLFEDSIFEIN